MKQELKRGDRVKVEFEGVVTESSDLVVRLRRRDNGAHIGEAPENCTLIEPEIVLPEIPGTIVQVDPLNNRAARCAFESDGDAWSESGLSGHVTTGELLKLCREYGYRVIPAAEAVTE